MRIFIKILIWVFVTIFTVTVVENCITVPYTNLNIIGVLLLLLYIWVTVETKFFTGL